MADKPRTLILLRHAKSAWPEGTPDIERPLGRRGRRDAPAVGQWLRREAPPIDLVVCSPATRTRQTWELATAQLNAEPQLRYDERLYGTSADVFLQVLQQQFQFADFAAAAVGIGCQKDGKHQYAQSCRPKMIGKTFQALPGERGKAGSQQDHEQQDPSPELRLFALQILRRPHMPRPTAGELVHRIPWVRN